MNLVYQLIFVITLDSLSGINFFNVFLTSHSKDGGNVVGVKTWLNPFINITLYMERYEYVS